MGRENNKLQWVLIGLGIFVIVILFVSLLFLIFSKDKLPENGVVVDNAILEGEAKNQEMVEKIKNIVKDNPALSELPMQVEYYTDGLSKYIKYEISYVFDDSNAGFYLIMKDYTAEGEEKLLTKAKELGFDMENVRYQYEDLSQDLMNGHAD